MDYQRRSRRTPSRGAASSPSHRNPSGGFGGRRKLPIPVLVLLDLAGAAIICGALYYSFIRPQALDVVPEDLPRPSDTVQAVETTPAAAQSSAPAAGESAAAEQSAAAAPGNTVNVDAGQFGAKFADKFSDDDGHFTENGYQSRNINLTLTKNQKENEDGSKLTYYVADIYVRDLKYLRTAFAKGTYGIGITESTPKMASANKAILAISGDYYGFQNDGPVVRNGKLYRKNTRDDDVCVLYNDGTMKTFASGEFDVSDVEQNGAWQVWCFGPQLLKDGRPMDSFTGGNSNLGKKNPRSSIGYFEPGHYAFVLVDGRQPGYSDGITFAGLSQLYADLGCKAAYNLDGGQSAVMYFNGDFADQPYNNGRSISDIIYIAEEQ